MQIRVCFTNLYVILYVATTRYLELFQITALLYESGLLLRVIRISVKVCIGVTLYDCKTLDATISPTCTRVNNLVHITM